MNKTEFTNEEIIKAFRCHINNGMCGDCPMCGKSTMDKSCYTLMFEDVLKLIEGQEEELEGYSVILDNLVTTTMVIKAEALKDFAERVRQRLLEKGFYPVIFKNTLNEVLSESEVIDMEGTFIPVNERKYYIEIDGIRLIYEEGELVGWYSPNGGVDE